MNYWRQCSAGNIHEIGGMLERKPCSKIVYLTCYTLLYTLLYTGFFLSKGKEKKYISLAASKVTQLFFLFDSQLIRHWNRAFLPITRRLSYLHTQRFSAKLKTIIPKKFFRKHCIYAVKMPSKLNHLISRFDEYVLT